MMSKATTMDYCICGCDERGHTDHGTGECIYFRCPAKHAPARVKKKLTVCKKFTPRKSYKHNAIAKRQVTFVAVPLWRFVCVPEVTVNNTYRESKKMCRNKPHIHTKVIKMLNYEIYMDDDAFEKLKVAINGVKV